MIQWYEYIEILVAIIVVVDPFGAIPIFIGLTNDQTDRQRARTAKVAALTSCLALLVASIIGEPVLKFFGISIASFRIAGGILIMILAISMMNAKVSYTKQTPEEAQEAVDRENVAVVPLAIPLLSGPAAMSTIIILAHRESELSYRLFLFGCIIFVALLIWLLFRISIPLSKRLGRTGLNIITRLMGLLLVAIAVEFIAAGLLQIFPGLG